MKRALGLIGMTGVALALLGTALSLWHGAGHADVYQRLESRLNNLAQLLPGRIGSGEPRLYVINGQVAGVELEQSHSSAARLIDYAARWHAAQLPSVADAIDIEAVATSADTGAQPMPEQHDSGTGDITDTGLLGFRGAGWAALAVFEPGHDFVGGQLPALKQLLMAVDTGGRQANQFWSLRFTSELDMAALINGPPAQALAKLPLTAIEPWPGSRAVFQLSEYSDHSQGHLLVFEGQGSATEHRRHFYRSLRNSFGDGLRMLGDADGSGAAAVIASPDQVFQVADGSREIAIYSDDGGAGQPVLDLIQIRVLQ